MTPQDESLREAVERLERQQREIAERLADLEARLPRRSTPKPERHAGPQHHAAATEARMGMTWVRAGRGSASLSILIAAYALLLAALGFATRLGVSACWDSDLSG
ncbi:MAG: hypothetical protein ACE15B_02740 [Bryobacteraceae bacterium]